MPKMVDLLFLYNIRKNIPKFGNALFATILIA